MKGIAFIKLFVLFAGITACADKNEKAETEVSTAKDTLATIPAAVPDTFETGKLIPAVVCKSNPSYSYALYIPAKGNKEPLPVIYFFDPHGDGTLPLNKYKALADRYNFILAGSNNSKNGNDWPVSESIWNSLSDDSKKRLKINVSRIYTCGFSGGAKVAGYVALNHAEVKEVLVGGAGLPDATRPGNFRFTLTSIAGEGDLNMTDLVAFNSALDNTQTKHRIIFFNGKHEWSPETTMDIAFAGLEFDAMREKIIPVNGVIINTYINSSKKRIADFLKENNYLKAEEECRLSVNLLEGISADVTWFNQKDASVKSSPVFQKQLKDRQTLLATEQNTKALYQQQFERGDMNYWTATIRDLQTKSKASTAEGAMNQRLIAYLSLAFYSISNQLIKTQQDKDARFFVDLYKTDDPTNSEGWYLSAILNARNNDVKMTEDDLQKAIINGFSDRNRMEQQPEFQNLRINLAAIEARMKK